MDNNRICGNCRWYSYMYYGGDYCNYRRHDTDYLAVCSQFVQYVSDDPDDYPNWEEDYEE